MSGLLPPLYNDDLDAFQFDNIFVGNSEDALSTFFFDIFSLPSFPQMSTSTLNQTAFHNEPSPQPQIQQRYRSDSDVLRNYYERVHPVFPLLPPPVNEQDVHDCQPLESEIFGNYEPSSPLILALLSILTLLPEPQSQSISQPERLESCTRLAQSLAEGAIESIEVLLDTQTKGSLAQSRTPAHPRIPIDPEIPLAFCVLSLFQYLHCGNIAEMVRLAEKGFDSSVALSLHNQVDDGSIYFEAKKRTWWMAYICVCYSSIVSCKPPTRCLMPGQVTTPYPLFQYSGLEDWGQYICAEETLVAATLLLVSLVKGFETDEATPVIREGIRILDNLIQSQLDIMSNEIHNPNRDNSPECKAAVCMKTITRMRLMSARIKTHRYCALMEHTPISRKFESFDALTSHSEFRKHPEAIKMYKLERATQVFPFTSEQSLRTCFDSSVGIADCLESLRANIHIAPFACSAVLSGYTSMMILHFNSIETLGSETSYCMEDQTFKCKHNVKAALDALDSGTGGFSFIRTLKDQLRQAAEACNAI